MATLYQLHSTMDTLRCCTEQMASTWRVGDSIILLGTTVAFIDWFNAYLGDSEGKEIKGIAAIYALAEDVAQLNDNTMAKLNLAAKLTAILSDDEWVALTQNVHANGATFDKVVTIAL
ncbi:MULTISPECIES: hypothetical protein [unclassified Psychrobacter]|uniref:hypothetical protein n=1 Tax=unclassified Psychrobacter TaxID=196806 RepID=UPI0025CFD704|nr:MULTISPECIES: hypothetical protein [unclassified Psychrobacter]